MTDSEKDDKNRSEEGLRLVPQNEKVMELISALHEEPKDSRVFIWKTLKKNW